MAAILQRVADQHRGDGEQTEGRESVHDFSEWGAEQLGQTVPVILRSAATAGATSSFETPAFGRLLRIRAGIERARFEFSYGPVATSAALRKSPIFSSFVTLRACSDFMFDSTENRMKPPFLRGTMK